MKMIHGLILALTLSVTLSLRAQETAPADPAPAPTEIAPPVPAPAPEISPAPDTESKPAPKKTKKTSTPAASAKSKIAVEITPPETTVLQHDNVNVRGRASFIGEVITKLRKGESVTLLEEITLSKTRKNEPANWYRIAMPTNTPVWISAHYIDSATKTVKPNKLQVRAGPGENFSVIGSLQKGDTVREIRTVENWMEIETPADTYAFVAADLIDRAPAAPPVEVEPTVPEPAPEVVQVPTAPETPVPAEPIEPPAAEPAAPAAEPIEPPVVIPEPVEEPLPKRIVTREGIVRRSFNVQTPSYFELESLETGKTINYLYSSRPRFTLKPLVGLRVIVTGEELIDRRWRNTPVIEIDTLHVVETP